MRDAVPPGRAERNVPAVVALFIYDTQAVEPQAVEVGAVDEGVGRQQRQGVPAQPLIEEQGYARQRQDDEQQV